MIRRYTPREYGAGEQNWAVAQDDRGVVYFGNNLGLLEYDGASWRLIRVPNQSVVRSLAKDDHGRIYAGAVSDFGYLELDAGGRTTFVSLLSHVPEEDRTFGDVWRTLVTPEGIYFQSQQYLFRWSNGRIRVWKARSRFHRAGVAHGVLYVGQPETGLMRMVGDSLEEVPGGRRFFDEPRPVILPYDGGRILVGTQADGLFLVDGQSVTRFPTEVDAWLHKMNLYRGTELPDGTMALATTGGGVAILDRQGRLQRIFDKSTGLEQQAYYVASDCQGALWLALDDGIARIETPSPISVFDPTSGLYGSVSYIHRHMGTLYVATAKGVYYLASSDSTSGPAGLRRTIPAFAPVEGISTNVQTWWLVSVDDPTGRTPSQLLVATGVGVYRIDGHRAVAIREAFDGSFQASVLYRSKRNPNRVFVGLFDGLASLRLDRGTWIFEGRVGGLGDEIRTIQEDADGRLWLGTAAHGAFRVTFWPPAGGAQDGALPLDPRVERFGAASGCRRPASRSPRSPGRRCSSRRTPSSGSTKATSRFTPDNTFKVVSVDPTGYGGFLREDARGDVWITFGREWAVERRQPDGSYKVEKQPFLRFAGFQSVATLRGRRRRGLVRRPRRARSLRPARAQGLRGRLFRPDSPRGRQRGECSALRPDGRRAAKVQVRSQHAPLRVRGSELRRRVGQPVPGTISTASTRTGRIGTGKPTGTSRTCRRATTASTCARETSTATSDARRCTPSPSSRRGIARGRRTGCISSFWRPAWSA